MHPDAVVATLTWLTGNGQAGEQIPATLNADRTRRWVRTVPDTAALGATSAVGICDWHIAHPGVDAVPRVAHIHVPDAGAGTRSRRRSHRHSWAPCVCARWVGRSGARGQAQAGRRETGQRQRAGERPFVAQFDIPSFVRCFGCVVVQGSTAGRYDYRSQVAEPPQHLRRYEDSSCRLRLRVAIAVPPAVCGVVRCIGVRVTATVLANRESRFRAVPFVVAPRWGCVRRVPRIALWAADQRQHMRHSPHIWPNGPTAGGRASCHCVRGPARGRRGCPSLPKIAERPPIGGQAIHPAPPPDARHTPRHIQDTVDSSPELAGGRLKNQSTQKD